MNEFDIPHTICKHKIYPYMFEIYFYPYHKYVTFISYETRYRPECCSKDSSHNLGHEDTCKRAINTTCASRGFLEIFGRVRSDGQRSQRWGGIRAEVLKGT